VKLNGANVKPARQINLGDKYDVKGADRRWTIEVTGLIQKRVAYEEAIKNYVDLTPEEDKLVNKQLGTSFYTGKRQSKTGRPTKKQRRGLDEFFGPEDVE
jgi:ribosome-associated heat shock protein Hsp15